MYRIWQPNLGRVKGYERMKLARTWAVATPTWRARYPLQLTASEEPAVRLQAEPISDDRYEQGESPRLDPRTGELLWVDIKNGTVHRGRLEGGRIRTVVNYDIGVRVGSIAPLAAPGAGWVLAVQEGFAHLSEPGLMRPIAGGLTTGSDQMNDGVCDPQGRFWAGSQAIPRRTAAALFRLDTDG